MEALMSRGSRALKECSVAAACLLLALRPGLAQNASQGSSPARGSTQQVTTSTEATRGVLIDKAHALESRGRPDMAVQLWQQILLSDPNNTEALAGLARDFKLTGSDQAEGALDRLRKANPNDPNIAKIQALSSNKAANAELGNAGALARQGRVDDAMKIYRELYGDHPPDGDIALAYYQTLYGTTNGKAEAVSGMRALTERNPGDPRFAVELGIMLTYEQKSRAEGIRLLKEHPRDVNAQTALRQALIWDSANPSSAAELKQYLKDHPQDTELTARLKDDEGKLAQMNSGIARTPAEKAAFAALNAHKLDEAEKDFTDILEQDPHNGRAAAGMGFLRMQQNNFGGAISFLAQAETNGYKERSVQDGLATSRFWYGMGEASQAFDQNQFDVAADKYRQALAMRPHSPEALNGLAGLYTKQQQYPAAAAIYEQLVKIQPGAVAPWRGLFLAYARDNQTQRATAVQARFPAGVKAALSKDPEYLRTLAVLYRAEGRPADAERVLAQALTLPFPENGATLKADTKLQYAGILMEAKRYDQAVTLYSQVLTDDASNLSAWMGLVSARHELGQDTEAIDDVQRMPPASYDAALSDPGFLSMLGAMYAQANQLEVAQGLLERSARQATAGGGQPSIALQLQLAAIYLQRNETAEAYAIYHRVLDANPDRVDAWKGLIAALQATHRDNEALQEISLIPVGVRKQLETDIEFVQTEASLYASAGDVAHAVEFMNRVEAHYAKLHVVAPANIEVQNAWLLFNTRNDRLLYPALMQLGGRSDLTVAQRETVEDIWANWSVRRAATAMDNGNVQRAVDILDAAGQAFPQNMTVRKAVAGGYVQVGRARESLALFKTVPMQDATAGDFDGAIGAALAAGDKAQAETWLRQALERYPRDPAVLELAARYEQARGDNQRAAEYYRASLAAMPSASPAQKLAHVLVYPDQDTRARRVVTAADLQKLLDPSEEPFSKTTKIPPLPAYGADPYNGSAPVVPHTERLRSGATATGMRPYPAQPYPTDPGFSPPVYTDPVQTQPIYAQPGQAASGQRQPVQYRTPMDAGTPLQPGPATQPGTGTPSSQATQADDDDLPLPAPNAGQDSATAPIYTPQAFHRSTGARDEDSGQSSVRLREGSGSQLHLVYATMQIDRRARLHLGPKFAARDAIETAAYVGSGTAVEPQSAVQIPTPQGSNALAPLTANAPHSPASDAWKGLVFSLMAANRNSEALEEVSKIPADVRAQLDADVEFEQGLASLYAAVGDSAHATQYMNRVEDYYMLHHTAPPAALDLQHAWMLYNAGDDHALYPVLLRLDQRADLTTSMRDQLATIWANWAVRRADWYLNNGFLLKGVQLLQSASEDYPNNLTVRAAVAGAYAKTGRPADALALYKTIPMAGATSGQYQGAIAAALQATDMAQAESWLRQALNRFPGDAQILALAARFEQARGNTARSADFWRASLAAMPPGSAAAKLDDGLVPAGSYSSPPPGDMKKLLDPRNEPATRTGALPPLPSYSNTGLTSAGRSLGSAPAQPAAQPRQPGTPWAQAPSSDPLPYPGAYSGASTGSGATANPPVYTPQNLGASKPLSQPMLVNQGASGAGNLQTANGVQTGAARTQNGSRVHTGTRSKATSDASSNLTPYMGRMNLPPSEETIGSTGSGDGNHPATLGSAGLDRQGSPQAAGAAASVPSSPNPEPNLRISAQPMGPVAAQAQALFADQIDGQLTQGSASAIHALPNAPVGPLPSQSGATTTAGQYNVIQYTPSAQEAATGAYSAPRQQQQQPSQPTTIAQTTTPPPIQTSGPLPPPQTAPQQCPAGCIPEPVKPRVVHRKRKPRPAANVPTLDQIPQEQPQQVQAPADVQTPAAAPTTDTGLSDDELQQRNLPPLRGPWVRVQRDGNPVSPRDEAEMQLRSIESGYSPWMAGTGLINYRTGNLGYDHLSTLEAPFELSMPLGYNVRFSIVARPVFLDSGQADGTSTITVQEQTTAGTSLVSIPQPIGTLVNAATTPPAQQNAVGIGGEIQLAFTHLALAGGYTPEGFLVATFTGRAMWKPANGPITFSFSRDPVKDTQLSYAGLRDPNGDTLGNLGQIWGGVVANQGQVQFAKGDAQSGLYVGGGGQYLTGYNVETNNRFDGSGGAYWRIKSAPEYGALSVGINFLGMHYAHNEDAFTHGMGGYFSPQAYFLANVPFTWAGHSGTHWHYNVLGSLGVQAFQEDLTKLWPLAVDEALETAQNNAMLPAKTSVGPNYDLRSNLSYQIGPHWFAGGFVSANNSRDYSTVSAGFSVHYMFRAQPSTVTTPTGLFPTDGLRPFTVP
jgi:tetratricopeptide (TPR) repeat protein